MLRPMAVATIRDLTVKYGSFTALKGLSCTVPEGCTGLLGPNGAGKTTLLKTLLGFVQPESGSVEVFGQGLTQSGREIRQRVGLMPEQDCHIPGMSAVQFVAYAGELAGMPQDQAIDRAHKVLRYAGLGEARYRNVETYSTGMKQRLKLAQALVHGPKLLLLDEPTNGLDPQGREEMLDLVHDVSHGKGINVLVSSHLLPDIERVCDRVIVVMGGEVRAEDTIANLKRMDAEIVDVELREANQWFIEAAAKRGLETLSVHRGVYRMKGTGTHAAIQQAALAAAKETGAQIRGYTAAERSLEDAFIQAVTSPR
ncbi:ABC transporter ATP-binding protein [bacterium]|nr:MAG: ABC transporter ATP-binding protein [bacterium]